MLFVDRNPESVHELRQSLQNCGLSLDLQTAAGGMEALARLKASPVDFIIADQRLADMDGVRLLERVQEEFPKTIRFILAEPSELSVVRRSVRCVHQFLARPIKADRLVCFIRRALDLRKLLHSPELAAVIGRIAHIPPLPRLFIEAGIELGRPHADLKKVGEIISKDMGMSSRILKLINSPFFSLSRRITKPEEAVVYLGVDLLKSIILFDELLHMDRMTGMPEIESSRMWEHGMLVSILVREILTAERASRETIETGKMAGILHDTGRLLLRKLPGAVAEPKPGGDDFRDESIALEKKAFKATHAEVGAYLFAIWGLPDDLVEAVAWHHSPGASLHPLESGVSAPGHDLLVPFALHVADAFSRRGTTDPALDLKGLHASGYESRVPAWIDLCMKAEQRIEKES